MHFDSSGYNHVGQGGVRNDPWITAKRGMAVGEYYFLAFEF